MGRNRSAILSPMPTSTAMLSMPTMLRRNPNASTILSERLTGLSPSIRPFPRDTENSLFVTDDVRFHVEYLTQRIDRHHFRRLAGCYDFPLAQREHVIRVARDEIQVMHHQYNRLAQLAIQPAD